jgi:hypothetical protein
MRRLLGAFLIVLGCAILVVEIPSIDAVVWSFSSGEGVHLSDLFGAAVVFVGIVALWTAPPRR